MFQEDDMKKTNIYLNNLFEEHIIIIIYCVVLHWIFVESFILTAEIVQDVNING